nr:hypothetical protein GCM10017547_35310 [Pseudarthrobacter oxydans]
MPWASKSGGQPAVEYLTASRSRAGGSAAEATTGPWAAVCCARRRLPSRTEPLALTILPPKGRLTGSLQGGRRGNG